MSKKIDQNNEYVTLLEDDSGNPISLQIDNATGRVLMEITNIASFTGSGKPIAIDQNNTYVGLGTDPNEDPIAILVENSNGLLAVDVTIE